MTSPNEYAIYQPRLNSKFDPIEFDAKVFRGYWPMTETCRRVQTTFNGNLPTISSGRILDLGCSIGITTEEIASTYSNCDIYGIDTNPKAIEIARERVKGKIEFTIGDGFKQPFPAEYFEGIFCMNNLGFTFNPEKPQIFGAHMDNILKMIKQEGHLFFSGGLCTAAIMQKVMDGYKIKSLLVGEHENEQYMAKFLLEHYQS